MSCVDLCEKNGYVDNNYFNIYKFPIHIDLDRNLSLSMLKCLRYTHEVILKPFYCSYFSTYILQCIIILILGVSELVSGVSVKGWFCHG
jgi:hypothetical protein